jgi:hypothetical protein
LKIHNVHERTLPVSADAVWRMLETLGGPDDRLWPRDRWPAMKLDGGLEHGARGHHSFIRYAVVGAEPGRRVRFRFRDMPGVDGEHGFEVLPAGDGAAVLRHVLDLEARGPFELYWRAMIGRMHDALLEDLLDRAEGRPPRGHDALVRAARALTRAARWRA